MYVGFPVKLAAHYPLFPTPENSRFHTANTYPERNPTAETVVLLLQPRRLPEYYDKIYMIKSQTFRRCGKGDGRFGRTINSEHHTKEDSGNRLLSLLRREVIPLCHRNNDNKKEECISYIPLFRPELFRKKSTGNG